MLTVKTVPSTLFYSFAKKLENFPSLQKFNSDAFRDVWPDLPAGSHSPHLFLTRDAFQSLKAQTHAAYSGQREGRGRRFAQLFRLYCCPFIAKRKVDYRILQVCNKYFSTFQGGAATREQTFVDIKSWSYAYKLGNMAVLELQQPHLVNFKLNWVADSPGSPLKNCKLTRENNIEILQYQKTLS